MTDSKPFKFSTKWAAREMTDLEFVEQCRRMQSPESSPIKTAKRFLEAIMRLERAALKLHENKESAE